MIFIYIIPALSTAWAVGRCGSAPGVAYPAVPSRAVSHARYKMIKPLIQALPDSKLVIQFGKPALRSRLGQAKRNRDQFHRIGQLAEIPEEGSVPVC